MNKVDEHSLGVSTLELVIESWSTTGPSPARHARLARRSFVLESSIAYTCTVFLSIFTLTWSKQKHEKVKLCTISICTSCASKGAAIWSALLLLPPLGALQCPRREMESDCSAIRYASKGSTKVIMIRAFASIHPSLGFSYQRFSAQGPFAVSASERPPGLDRGHVAAADSWCPDSCGKVNGSSIANGWMAFGWRAANDLRRRWRKRRRKFILIKLMMAMTISKKKKLEIREKATTNRW